ncbi:MAG: protein kinase domain-containing protein [Vicinamibacterales bacterium]
MSAIGAGGMGEVYRARDTNLNRDVALKILPESFALDADRVARFKREAQVLASLNHPNIAAIYGIESHALVMELVEGEDLSAVIKRGAMPLADALPISRQIADALETAHEHGIIHRDLKPANINVRSDGTVKVLDFGLAKALDPVASSAEAAALANSPTITSPARTETGVILGTAAYMSPEQARGKVVDRRADIWAFGCVVYELLSSRRAFPGDHTADVLASVLKGDAHWEALPSDLPAPLRRLLRRCLEKDPKKRLSAIGDARLELDEAASGQSDSSATAAPVQVAVVPPLWRRALPWAVVAGALTIALVLALVLRSPWTTAPAPTPRKLLASIGADASLPTNTGPSVILSPDGTTLAFVAQLGGATRLFVRKLDQLEAVALAGADGAADPFFSPDGQWIAFFADGSLKKVSATGGEAVTLCEAPSGRGGTWADDDTIIFAPASLSALLRVPAAGGTPAPFATLSEGAVTQRWPQALPGGAGVLFTEGSSRITLVDTGNIVVVPRQGGAPKIVVRGGSFSRYLPSGPASPTRDPRDGGYLVYMKGSTLFGIRFDLSRLEVVGQAVQVLQGVSAFPTTGGAQLAFASDGTLVYVPGGVSSPTHAIDWTTRDGKTSVLRAAKADWANPRLSPDGQKLAMDISDGTQRDIWVYEWARDTLTQVTFDPSDDGFPVWTPDGKRIVFASDRAKQGVANVYWVKADGTGAVSRLTDSPVPQYPTSWHPSGQFLIFEQLTAGPTGWDLMIVPMEGDTAHGWTPGKPRVFLATAAAEFQPMFSPDGRWMAYASNAAGSNSNTYDVYVRAFPGPGGPWRISTASGVFPLWSPTAHELLFTSSFSGGQVLFAPYTVVGDSFQADKPQVWTPTGVVGLGTNSPYDIHPDSKRLALAAAADQSVVVQDKVVFLFNFVDYLEKTVAGKQ